MSAKIMQENFSMFIRRHIVLLVVITFTANVIMFSAVLQTTGSIPSEQANFVHSINTSHDYYKKEVGHVNTKKHKENSAMNSKKLANNVRLKKTKHDDWKIYSKDKGQMDFVPPKRMVNKQNEKRENNELLYQKSLDETKVLPPNAIASESRKENAIKQINALANANNSKVYQLYDDNAPADYIQVRKSKQGYNENQKVPNTFNEEYIKYFWRHSELNRNNLKVEQQESSEKKKIHDKTDNQKIKDDPDYMTVFPAKGQLGNQMFQLASLLGIAERGNFTPFLPMSVFELNKFFRFPKGFSRDIDISSFQKFSDYNYTQDTSIKLSQKLDIHKNWTLDGYFQSFKYFSHITQKIRKYLKLHKHLLRVAVEFMQKTVPARHIKIAIHIRRGDFISSYQMWLGRVAATPKYVHKAMQYFQSKYNNITFIVVSDDMIWCKEYIKGDNVVYSTSHYNEKGVDMAIISRCDHAIISVGTFGWWGGWLAGGTVVYYNKFPRPGSKLDQTFVPENYYPSNWIALE